MCKTSGYLTMEDGEYSKELDIAVRVVHLSCALCRRVQEGLLENGNAQVKAKDDDSPVTIAGILSLFCCFIDVPFLVVVECYC